MPGLLIEYRIHRVPVRIINGYSGSILDDFEIAVLLGIVALVVCIVSEEVEIQGLSAVQPPLNTGLETHPVDIHVIVTDIVALYLGE